MLRDDFWFPQKTNLDGYHQERCLMKNATRLISPINDGNLPQDQCVHNIFKTPNMKFLYKKAHNAKISIKRREQLIDSVICEGKSITYAAKKLRIKYSTARIIITKYKETGKIFDKNMHRRDQQPDSQKCHSEKPQGEVEFMEQNVDDSDHQEEQEIQEENSQFYAGNRIEVPEPQNMFFYFCPFYNWQAN